MIKKLSVMGIILIILLAMSPSLAMADTLHDDPTPTDTFTPTATFTPMPTLTPWPTATATYTKTPTPTATLAATFTPGGPTATITPTPFSSIIWAQGLYTLEAEQQAGINALLISIPPSGVTTNIYAVTDIRTINDYLAVISIVNLIDVSAPYSDWNAETNGAWVGSVTVDTSSVPYAYYFVPPESTIGGGSMPVVRWPYESGYGAYYGIKGVHTAFGVPSIDLIPDGGHYAFAVADGTVSWVCESGYDQVIKLDTAQGSFIYVHLYPGTTTQGTHFNDGEFIGYLVEEAYTSTADYCRTYSTGAHIHLGLPNVGFVQFEGCILDISTQYFTCSDGEVIGTLGQLPVAGGYTMPIPTLGAGTEMPDTYIAEVGGGEHIWNGIINGGAVFISTRTADLPEHEDSGIKQALQNGVQEVSDIYFIVTALGLLYIIPALLLFIAQLQMEIIRGVMVAYRWIVSLEPIK